MAPLCHGAEPLGQGARAGGCSLLERSILVLLLRREAGELQVSLAAWGSLEAMRFLSSLCVASNKIKQTIPPWYLLPECAALLRRPAPKTPSSLPQGVFLSPCTGGRRWWWGLAEAEGARTPLLPAAAPPAGLIASGEGFQPFIFFWGGVPYHFCLPLPHFSPSISPPSTGHRRTARPGDPLLPPCLQPPPIPRPLLSPAGGC